MRVEDAPMLEVEHQTIEGRLREESGKTSEETESNALSSHAALLAQAAEVGAQAAAGSRESGWKGDWLVLLQALCQLTAKQAEAGDPSPSFTAERLREEIAEILSGPEAQWWTGDTDNARKKFTNAWKALESDLARLDRNLRGRAIKSGVPGQIALKPPARLGTTNAMGYGLTALPLELPAAPPAPAPLPSASGERVAMSTRLEISYQEEMEVYPVPGLKRPLRISLPGWRGALIATPLIGALAIGGLLAWFLLTIWLSNEPPRVIFKWTVITTLVAGMVAWLCHPFYALINDRIVRAPTLLETTLPLGHVLVLRRESEDRVLRMVRYTAQCPICDGEVTIEKGRRQHRGRLVGECNRNPVEHTFSFDFITGKGWQL